MTKVAILSVAGLIVLTSSLAQAAPGDRLRARIAARSAIDQIPAAAPDQTIRYGRDPLQVLDFWPAKATSVPAPLVVFVHGGGWSKGSKDNGTGHWKAVHYPAQDYGFASINYRLVPAATPEQQAQDVADSLAALLARAAQLGIDPRRVVLMGHSAGAHLVALVGTDERYLRAAGLSFANLAGVIPIDGAAYDVPAQFAQAGPRMKRTYEAAFGTDPARQRSLSPTLHAAAPNAPAFLVPHVQREDGVRQSAALVAALKAAGTMADAASFPGEGLMGHMEINRSMGDPDYAATPVVDAWMKRMFGN
jgi:arylformamidase